MIVSYLWLQTYFKDKLPTPEKVAEVLTFSAFEIESIEKTENGDTVIDVKVLPDRAHYALCHRGVARELAAGLRVVFDEKDTKEIKPNSNKTVSIKIENKDDCRRYIGRFVENIKISDSPKWLALKLATLGQRPIANVVDIANFVMFDMGQPLHAFDADKVKGGIVIRRAKIGEKITTLDNREVDLDEETLIIADAESPLAIAGIKGGKKAEVTSETKNLILESANFDPVLIRKTSQRLDIKTDASKRFENEITPVWANTAMTEFSDLISSECEGVKFGEVFDVYPNVAKTREIEVGVDFINSVLGINIPENIFTAILESLCIEILANANREYKLLIPPERLDLVLSEDIAEEIGRLYGYDKVLPSESRIASVAPINKNLYYETKIRGVLVGTGFSEILTSSFANKTGELEVLKPMATDKNCLRTTLSTNMISALKFNIHQADFLGLDSIRIFEIGKVFGKDGERCVLELGARQVKKVKSVSGEKIIKDAVLSLEEVLGVKIDVVVNRKKDDFFATLDLDKIISDLPDARKWDIEIGLAKQDKKFEPFSVFPFIVRDIAIFVPSGTGDNEPNEVIRKTGGEFLKKIRLFDVFEKKSEDGSLKTSYAFRLVFQSHDRTLTDLEINTIMENVENNLNSIDGWKVR